MSVLKKNSYVLHGYIFLVLFTTLRNISSLYYLVIAALTVYFFVVSEKRPIKLGAHAILFYCFVMYTILVIVWSGLYMNSLEFLPGIPRALLMITVTFILFMNVKYDYQVVNIIKILLFCYVIGALTIIYQIFFGHIPWFVQYVGRANMIRYPSILGSLTIYGSVSGYPVIMILSRLQIIRKFLNKILLLTIVMSATFFSLSKTGVMMLVISFCVLILMNRKFVISKIFRITTFLYTFIIIIIGIALIYNVQELQNYYNAAVTHTFGANNLFADSSSVLIDSPRVSIDHVMHRLFYWTIGMIDIYGDMVYFTGVGLQGGGGTMGIHNYSMAHNAFGDLFFMGGVPYLFIFLALYSFTQYTHFVNRRNMISRMLFMLNILFLTNMVIASGTVFQPSISAPFWLSVVYANIINSRKRLTVHLKN